MPRLSLAQGMRKPACVHVCVWRDGGAWMWDRGEVCAQAGLETWEKQGQGFRDGSTHVIFGGSRGAASPPML